AVAGVGRVAAKQERTPWPGVSFAFVRGLGNNSDTRYADTWPGDRSTKQPRRTETVPSRHLCEGHSILVVADTTDLVTDLCVEEGLLEHLACRMARPPVGGLFYRS